MDRSWIKGVRRLLVEHTKGVKEFMQFVRRSVAEDSHVLCPCRSCLNRAQQPSDAEEVDDKLVKKKGKVQTLSCLGWELYVVCFLFSYIAEFSCDLILPSLPFIRHPAGF